MITLITGCRSGFGLLTAVEAANAGHIVYAGLRDLNRVLSLVDEKADDVAGDPRDVAVRIVKVLGQARPRLRHPMGPGATARTWLKAMAPFGAIERVLQRVVKLPKP